MVRPLVEAASYARRYPTLGLIILVSVAPGAIGLSYTFLLPVVIRDLGANPGTIGLLYVGAGIGGLMAGLAAEPIMRRVGHGRTIFVGMGLIGTGLIGVGLSGALALAAVAIAVAQGGFAIYGSSSLSLVQSLSPARLRGRVTSLFTLLYWGLMPFGALAGRAHRRAVERSRRGHAGRLRCASSAERSCSSSGRRSQRSGSIAPRAPSPVGSTAAGTHVPARSDPKHGGCSRPARTEKRSAARNASSGGQSTVVDRDQVDAVPVTVGAMSGCRLRAAAPGSHGVPSIGSR